MLPTLLLPIDAPKRKAPATPKTDDKRKSKETLAEASRPSSNRGLPSSQEDLRRESSALDDAASSAEPEQEKSLFDKVVERAQDALYAQDRQEAQIDPSEFYEDLREALDEIQEYMKLRRATVAQSVQLENLQSRLRTELGIDGDGRNESQDSKQDLLPGDTQED